MKKIFLVGSPFCGSTIAGNILNSHKEIFHAGEVDRLRLFRRYHGADANLSVDGCALCGLRHGVVCPVWDDLPPAPRTPVETVTTYEALLRRGGKPVVVDSSKNVDWLAHLRSHGLRDAVAVVLSRNPFAFARSHHRAVFDPYWHGVEIWRNIYNHCLRGLIHQGIPFIALKHEQLTQAPEEFFASIIGFCGLTGEVDSQCYFETETHAVAGNVGAFVSYAAFNKAEYLEREKRQQRFSDEEELQEKTALPAIPKERADNGWLEALSMGDIDAGLSIPGVMDVMSLLGYSPAALVSAKQQWDMAKSGSPPTVKERLDLPL